MRKKYQVFISSTYIDLMDERQFAVKAILNAGHIPAGMELFKAGNDTQLQTIYKWIDESDVYMLILGGRYGTIEEKSKKSYTQLEYEYAMIKKMPIFTIVLSDLYLDYKARQLDNNILFDTNLDIYKNFRAMVMKKIVKFVNKPEEISSEIMGALAEIDKNYDIHGWISGYDFEQLKYNYNYYKISDRNNRLKMKELMQETKNKKLEFLTAIIPSIITFFTYVYLLVKGDKSE